MKPKSYSLRLPQRARSARRTLALGVLAAIFQRAYAVASDPVEPGLVRWLAVAGGGTPDATQVSIEQDVALAARVLAGPGVILFAGGKGSHDVQVLASGSPGDELARALGALLAPRAGRDTRYRPSRLRVDGATTRAEVQRTIDRLVSAGQAPLVIYLAGHGETSPEGPAHNSITLWGPEPLSARELASWLDRAVRPVRLVVTTCYAGGFAELAFRGADARRGASRVLRCGLFATPHDLPASGCDPNPDRAAQQGYALHFFNALAGRDRDGQAAPRGAFDYDRDGRVSPLEAHARVRIASRGPDVPTTTAERWLHHIAPKGGVRRAVALPEERAVIAALAQETGLGQRERAVKERLAALERTIRAVREHAEKASERSDEAARIAIIELLGRWPVLDDPWHPDFRRTLEQHRGAIAAHLARSTAYARYLAAQRQADAADNRYWDLRRDAAPIERLARALETVKLAERLRARGGGAWRRYEQLLSCERAP